MCASVRASSYTKRLWKRDLINRSWEFHQIYKCAVGSKIELSEFWGQKVKGQGHRQQFPKKTLFGGGISIDGSPSSLFHFSFIVSVKLTQLSPVLALLSPVLTLASVHQPQQSRTSLIDVKLGEINQLQPFAVCVGSGHTDTVNSTDCVS